MLLICQFPICDARGFVSERDPRLPAPPWPLPEPGRHFVRCFGSVRRRLQGGHDYWADEAFFSRAHRALRFDRLETRWLGALVKPRCAFRRLFSDGLALVRFELAAANDRPAPLPEASRILHLLSDYLDLPVSVTGFRSDPLTCNLWLAGKHLAELYADVTEAARGESGSVSRELVTAAEPMLLVEYGREEIPCLPPEAWPVGPSQPGGAKLAYCWLRHRGREIGVWLLQNDESTGWRVPKSRRGSKAALQASPSREPARRTRRGREDARQLRPLCDTARQTRIGLLRLHAEHQVLKQVLNLLTRGAVRYTPGSPAADRLDAYLNEATRVLGRETSGPIPLKAIRNEILAYEELVRPEERQILTENLLRVRRKVEAYVDTTVGARTGRVDFAGDLDAAAEGENAPPPFPAFLGTDPYVFVSYAHKDRPVVYPEITELHRRGYRIWYDEGIAPGVSWTKQLADAIERSVCVLLFVSPRLIASRHCLDEIFFAIECGKPVVAVYLEKTDLPKELAFLLGRQQAILRYAMDSQRFGNLLARALPGHLVELAERGVDTAVEPPQSGPVGPP
jgi:hypothetical protein